MKDLYEYSTPELVRLLGNRFREYRMRCNLTQKEVAELTYDAMVVGATPEIADEVLGDGTDVAQWNGIKLGGSW